MDAESESVVRQVPVGVDPRAVSFSPSGDRVFVTNAGSGEIHVLSTRDETLTSIYEIGEGARGIAVFPPRHSMRPAPIRLIPPASLPGSASKGSTPTPSTPRYGSSSHRIDQ